ncbi:MAG: FlgD immunoglobulin-like domain containing protein, partial [Bacteroidota bacterium]|nr:FlgD immunoglobulin-like domain containing protein [Bacteroidota bacterium]
VSMEAENYTSQEGYSIVYRSDASGTQAMQVGSDGSLNYSITLNTAGTWYIWIRAYATTAENNGLFIKLDGETLTAPEDNPYAGVPDIYLTKNGWCWKPEWKGPGDGEHEGPITMTASAGTHILSICKRKMEDPLIDKILLTLTDSPPEDSSYGPDETTGGDKIISIVAIDSSNMDPGPWLSSLESGDDDITWRPELHVHYTNNSETVTKVYKREIGGDNPLAYFIANNQSSGNFYDINDGTSYSGYKYGDSWFIKQFRNRISFFQCDLTAIPSTATVDSVIFKGHVEPLEGRSSDGIIGIYKCTAEWTKADITNSISDYRGDLITAFSVTENTFIKGSDWWTWNWDDALVAYVQETVSGISVAINEHRESTQSGQFELLGNYPNPFNLTTTIRFKVNSAMVDDAIIKIINPLGQIVDLLTVKTHGSGVYKVTWNGVTQSGQSAPSGNYFYTVDLGAGILSGQMTLVK